MDEKKNFPRSTFAYCSDGEPGADKRSRTIFLQRAHVCGNELDSRPCGLWHARWPVIGRHCTMHLCLLFCSAQGAFCLGCSWVLDLLLQLHLHSVDLAGIGIVVGSLMGTSPLTVFIESATGIREGGRTGLTACITGCCFFIALFFAPLLGEPNALCKRGKHIHSLSKDVASCKLTSFLRT